MAKLTDKQIELIAKFADTFGCYFVDGEKEISFEEAVAIFNQEQPKPKTIDDRRAEFGETLRPHLLEYGKEMLNKFYRYWAVQEGTKMKWEKQTSWDLKKRLDNWKRNDEEWERQRYIQQLNNRL